MGSTLPAACGRSLPCGEEMPRGTGRNAPWWWAYGEVMDRLSKVAVFNVPLTPLVTASPMYCLPHGAMV